MEAINKAKPAAAKGTYVRTVIEDIGRALGCGAVMTALRRTVSGCFTIADSFTLDMLEALDMQARQAALRPVEAAFADLPALTLAPFFAKLAHDGCEIYQKKVGAAYPVGTRLRLCDADGFFALGEVRDYEAGTAVKPIKQLKV